MKDDKNLKDFWIQDHCSRTYDLRDEIKSRGGYWVPTEKMWRIDGIERGSTTHKVLSACGLHLEEVFSPTKRK